MCKTCSEKKIFVRKVSADSNLYQVEKKFCKTGLIYFVTA